MNTIKSVPDGRDPVAFAIEKYLRNLEQDGTHKLSIKARPLGVRVGFAGESAEADSLDIALIRLCALLLNRDAFREELVKALRGPVAIEDVKLNRVSRFGFAGLRPE